MKTFREWLKQKELTKTETTDTGQIASYARPVMMREPIWRKNGRKNLQKLPTLQ